MSEMSTNQSTTTMTTLHTVSMKDAICSDYNISMYCQTSINHTSNIIICSLQSSYIQQSSNYKSHQELTRYNKDVQCSDTIIPQY